MKRARMDVDLAKLNVGGKVFHGSTRTLAGIDVFDPLLDGRFPWDAGEDGHVFIDRDGDLLGIKQNTPRYSTGSN